MKREDKLDLYSKAIEKWGEKIQLDMMIEECAELIKEIIKLKRGNDDYNPIHEEIADTEIMLEQMRFIFGDEDIDKIKNIKLHRLKKRLEND